jgi:hypothetical protein
MVQEKLPLKKKQYFVVDNFLWVFYSINIEKRVQNINNRLGLSFDGVNCKFGKNQFLENTKLLGH